MICLSVQLALLWYYFNETTTERERLEFEGILLERMYGPNVGEEGEPSDDELERIGREYITDMLAAR